VEVEGWFYRVQQVLALAGDLRGEGIFVCECSANEKWDILDGLYCPKRPQGGDPKIVPAARLI
jgi:hypothetical protein